MLCQCMCRQSRLDSCVTKKNSRSHEARALILLLKIDRTQTNTIGLRQFRLLLLLKSLVELKFSLHLTVSGIFSSESKPAYAEIL